MRFVLGVDAGGTGSRAVLTTVDGAVLGRGAAGPGNLCAGVPAVAAIGAAVRAALGCHDPRLVAGVVAGVAGISGLADPAVPRALDRAWAALGLTCPVRVVADAVTAFAAGSPERTGAVLIAGTGAVAAAVDGLRVTRTADGLGWLLGDEGSGTWLGLEAVRAAARGATPPAAAPGAPGSFFAQVFAHAGVSSADALIAWAGRQPPSAFAGLAPLICASDHPVAVRIVAGAVSRLLGTLAELGAPGGPVVLAGGLLAAATPVQRGVLAALGDRARVAGDPASAAARLAAAVR